MHHSMKTLCRFAPIVLLASAAIIPGPEARAAEPRRAEVLFTQAMELMTSGDNEKACPMLEESLALEPAMGTRYRLAECFEKTNRKRAAYDLYGQVAKEARLTGMVEREAWARDRAAALEAQFVRIVIWVPPEVSQTKGLRVTLDGAELEKDQSNFEAAFVELGEHVLEATAEGREPYRRALHVVAQDEPVELSVPALRDPNAPKPEEAPPTKVEVAPKEGPKELSAGQKTALVLGFAGAGAIVASAGIAGMAMADGRFAGTTSITALAGLGLGGALAVSGIAVAIASSQKGKGAPRAAETSLVLVPLASPEGGGAALSGTF